MKNSISHLIIITLAVLMTACGTARKAATTTLPDNGTGGQTGTVASDPLAAVMATLGDWQTLQTGGNISLKGSTSFSSSIQVRMVKDQAIFISLRPMLGIEVGRLLITGDSLYVVDKVHKRYMAEKVSMLTAGIPVTVSDVQDIFLGRPFVIGKGTLGQELEDQVTTAVEGSTLYIRANQSFKGYGYAFAYDKANRIATLSIVPDGSLSPAYVVDYSDVQSTQAGNIAHGINVNATVEKHKLNFKLTYKDIDWNGKVKIDRSIPSGYSRMSATSLINIFSN